MGIIYLITSPKGHQYVGQTHKSLMTRWKGHIENAKNKKSLSYNNLLQQAIRFFGEDNFSLQILEENIETQKELNDKEIFWINKINTFYFKNPKGLNMTEGGAGFKRTRPICQYTLEGKYIKTWNNIHEVSDFFNCPERNIHAALIYEYSHFKGFLWKYEDDTIPIQKNVSFYQTKQKRKGGGYQVICVETGECFHSYRELARKIGVSRSRLSKQIKNNGYFIYKNKCYKEKKMNFFEMDIQKYWAPTSSISPEQKRQYLEIMMASKNYLFSEKIDGNFSRAIITPEKSVLQTRGISKKTGTFGEIQDKVFWWDDVVNAFSDTTILLGEVYLPGGIDKNVGSILRCDTEKAKSIQDTEYYYGATVRTKFSKKDLRDIEQNEFRNQWLRWYIFDVLAYNGEVLLDKTIEERIKYIPKVVSRINNSYVSGAIYQEMDENFFDKLNYIFSRGGEGCVCYKKGTFYTPGKRTSAWNTCKVKREITSEIDCFITGIEPAIKSYTGKDIVSWPYWINIKTGEKLYGQYFSEYREGIQNLEPITKGFFNGWPGAIICSVYDNNHNFYEICRCAGLLEEWKEDMKNNFKENWYLRPVKISGMMLSQGKDKISYSIRHPVIKSFRDNDVNIEDCSLEKIIGE